jgi:hypothetical protein
LGLRLLLSERFRVEQDPFFRLLENLLNQPGVERVPRPFRNDVADERRAEKRKITDKVQDLVTDELVKKSKS